MSGQKALFGKIKKDRLRSLGGRGILFALIPTRPLLQDSDAKKPPFPWNSYLSYGLAVARASLGAVAYLAPTVPSIPWVGKEESSRHSVRLFARTLGARDLALGLGHLYSLTQDKDSQRWLLAGAVADLGDTVATIIDFKKLPKPYAYGVLASTVSACALGIYLAVAD